MAKPIYDPTADYDHDCDGNDLACPICAWIDQMEREHKARLALRDALALSPTSGGARPGGA